MRKSLRPRLGRLASMAAVCAIGLSSSPAFADSMYVSYGVKTDDPVYPYTGFSVNEDVDQVNMLIKYDAGMLRDYVGGKIRKVHIGWSGVYQDYTPVADVYVRKSLNGENLAGAEVALEGTDGWNIAEFENPYVIGENEDLYVGYSVEMWEAVFGPCTITWGSFPEQTHFISRNDYLDEDGNPEWIDLSEPGMMDGAYPIMFVLEIEIGEGEMQNKAMVSQLALPSMLLAGTEATGAMRVANTGSNDINAITISYSQDGKEVYSHDLELSKPIAKGDDGLIGVPVSADYTGDVEIRISRVNGVANSDDHVSGFAPLVVGKETAARFTRRPLVEYFGSENEYRSYAYDSELVTPNLAGHRDRVSRIDWHFDDQFQLGLADDKDEVLDMLIEVAKNDSSSVYVPTLMLDRDMNLGIDLAFSVSYLKTPMIGVLYSPAAEMGYEYALAQPTFAALKVNASLEDETISVEVDGEADLSVLPEGEKLMLTVVLVEDGVESDSQEMPGGDGEGPNAGHAVHNNLVRQRLTDIWGDPIEFADGKFSMSFSTYLDYDNVPDNMRVVAFINRCKDNGMWERNVINSAECVLTTSGVGMAEADIQALRPSVVNGSVVACAGTTVKVFTPAGVMMSPDNLPAGVYVARVEASNGVAASFKLVIR